MPVKKSFNFATMNLKYSSFCRSYTGKKLCRQSRALKMKSMN